MSYSPTMMRWLQAEPDGGAYVDGMNLYWGLGNNPNVYTDPSGLTIQDHALNALKAVGARYRESVAHNYMYAKITGLNDMLFHFVGILLSPSVNFTELTDPTANGKYRPKDNMFLLQNRPAGSLVEQMTIVHELVHASLDLAGVVLTDRENEGEAYAVQNMIESLLPLGGLEKELNKAMPDVNNLQSRWRSVGASFSQYGKWEVLVGAGKFFARPSDITNVSRDLNFHMSMQEIADAYNAEADARGHCIYFTTEVQTVAVKRDDGKIPIYLRYPLPAVFA